MEEPVIGSTCCNTASVIFDCRGNKHSRTNMPRRKIQKERVIYKGVALLALVGGACIVNHYTDTVSLNTDKMVKQNNETWRTTSKKGNHLLRDLSSNITKKSSDGAECSSPGEIANSKILLFAVIAGVLYMFVAIAIVCDEFFVPALEEIASENYLNLSMDVAGATLMAAGGSAPELFTSFIGTFQRSEVGFGTIVGSAVFNVLFVIGFCAISSKEVLTLTWWPLARDCAYYSVSLLMLAFFCGYSSPGIIEVWEAVFQLGLYIGYVLFMHFNESIWSRIEKKINQGKVSNEQDDEQNNRGALSLGIKRPSTFRAGLLDLFVGKLAILDKVGITMVTKICGDVETVFKTLNESGDGYIDNTEFHRLVELLDSSIPDSEINQALQELDENDDGKIDLTEFTKWYVKSERTLKAELRNTFDKFDLDKSGTIDVNELRQLMKELGAEVKEEYIKATLEEAYTNGPSDQISYDEFQNWYTESKYWNEHRSKVNACTDESVEPISNHLKLPSSGGIITYIRWVLLFPIVCVLCLTVPDVRQPGKSKLCFFSFIVSIIWIGLFTYIMVSCAEIIGATLGVPMVLMGLTVLAAGTSVPDLLSSVIVARMGEGDMAVSSSIGSNIFDITVGLPFPWLMYYAVNAGEKKAIAVSPQVI